MIVEHKYAKEKSMDKVILNETYGFKNFISNKEKEILLEWVEKNQSHFIKNNSNYRKYVILNRIKNYPKEIVTRLRNRIIEIDNIGEWIEEPLFYDLISINEEFGNIHPHTDPNVNGYIHTRYNIILKYPIEGGHSIYGNSINVLEENMVWKCIAGEVMHASTPVVGNIPRITLSMGFQIKIQIKNEKYKQTLL
jgi:hypothetical protein